MKECNVLPLHFVEGTFEELRCQNCELDSTGSDVNITHSQKTSRKPNGKAIDADCRYLTQEFRSANGTCFLETEAYHIRDLKPLRV